MKKIRLFLSFILLCGFVKSQVPGDTIVVKAFKYGSATRDTMIKFPPSNLTYEKVILKYNMRCKNGLVSTQAQPNLGCGEWDYSCNTFIVDSTKLEKALNLHPSHIISNFTGTAFGYVTQPVFDYYNFSQTTVTLNNVISENQYTVGTGSSSLAELLKSNEKSGRSQILYTAAELTGAGFTAGNIDGILMNVSNAGGGVNFFKVGVQHTAATALNSAAVTQSGFTNVFNQHFSFVAGQNRLQFHTAFVWDGVSNVLIDFSFTNTVPSNPIVFSGTGSASTMLLYTTNNYALDLSALGHVVMNTSALAAINNEMTVSFWAYGNAAQMPVNTVLFHSYAATPAQRQLNIHLPWGNSSVYFDCGYNNGYDRIDKVSTASEQGGQWNHWTFTKNATSGNMRIYLNGVLWHSGTAKTKAISILNLILGKDADLLNNYKGKINELSIWNKELAAADIAAWMNKPVTASHPNYANLMAYYRMNEGTGLTITDSKNSLTSSGVNLQWTYDRGQNLSRSFTESNVRPNVVFFRGTYAMSTTTLIAKDSVARNPNVVQQYSITTGVAPANDVVALVSTSNLYKADPSKVYDGDTGLQTGTIAVTGTGTITINNMNYYKYYPFYNEILSFVTPYGKGLNLGPKGKTWYYDVTDFTPLFKGSKRLLMSMGGENQEQLDIDFIFIVGTPPRNIVEFNQLWQGGARIGGPSIASIVNNTNFAPLNVPIHPGGQSFKLRSTITGHGGQGEFLQNGGQVNHMFNIDGGAPEFTWQISKSCSQNPIYPQGGTWVYGRQGWCPGETSPTKEYDLTSHLTAGATATLDYQTSAPPNPTGDYRYIVANQLITYAAPNHLTDAAIIDVISPSDKVLYSRVNPACGNPVILVRNTGSLSITGIDLEYWVNDATTKQSHTWTGDLASMDTVSIVLPVNTLWLYGINGSQNTFKAEIKMVNGVTDDYPFNNIYRSPFVVPGWVTPNFTIEFKTNNTLDNAYTLVDENGTVIGQSNFVAANTVYQDAYNLNGCYKLIIEDGGGDGLSWWANTAQGVGYARIKNDVNSTIKTFEPDFGGRIEYSFTTHGPLSVAKNALEEGLNLYPNPAHGKFILQSPDLEGAQISVTNLLGQTVTVPSSKKSSAIEFDSSSLTPGIYFVTVSKGRDTVTKKVVVK